MRPKSWLMVLRLKIHHLIAFHWHTYKSISTSLVTSWMNNELHHYFASLFSVKNTSILCLFRMRHLHWCFKAQTRCLEKERKAEEKQDGKKKQLRKAPLSALGVLRRRNSPLAFEKIHENIFDQQAQKFRRSCWSRPKNTVYETFIYKRTQSRKHVSQSKFAMLL